ncbi:hypothetical protein C4J93_1372 [Pseudomonas sp. R2-37-08W]|nr:hypothetical protein C4J93_1372 [Pseudomonas sp. R2-37-08W]AZF14784.1 hypothetical protein C4J92_1284 [Pseudomonas sp. R3-18-08]AZF46595.1 hypothetical protein C4J86_1344 [Pseudomonas sp. R2-7-07]AZF57142.1 hypothetical protein C4J84_1249 [Pseudomonas sp. R11-23-07]
MTNQRLQGLRHPGHRVDTCVDLSSAGHPRKAAHFIPQQGRKRNPQSHLPQASLRQPFEWRRYTPTL